MKKTDSFSKDDIKDLTDLFELLLEWELEEAHQLRMKLANYPLFKIQHQAVTFNSLIPKLFFCGRR